MSKEMSSHEYAKFLLSKEDKPIYEEAYYEINGESRKGYRAVTGVVEEKIESAYLIKTSDKLVKLNDNFFEIGDTLAYVDDIEIKINKNDFIYVSFCKEAIYYGLDYPEISDYWFGFYNYENNDYPCKYKKINKLKIKVAMSRGFKPVWKEMNLEEVMIYYKKNFNDTIDLYVNNQTLKDVDSY